MVPDSICYKMTLKGHLTQTAMFICYLCNQFRPCALPSLGICRKFYQVKSTVANSHLKDTKYIPININEKKILT